jgi:hypothetical protein
MTVEPELSNQDLELQMGIHSELSTDLQQYARYTLNGDNIVLDFPAIQFENLDFKDGISRAMSKFGGAMKKNQTTQQVEIWFTRHCEKDTQSFTAHVTQKQQTKIQSYPGNTTINKQENLRGEKKVMNEKMTMDEYIKSNGIYVSAKNCKIGDTFIITAPFYFEKQTFKDEEKISCFIDVEKEPSKEKMKIRLNKENCGNLIGTFTTDGAQWTGKRIRILNIKRYNLGEGFIYAPA